MLEFAHVADLTILVGAPIEVGRRRVIPITGGEAHGPKLRGNILPGGADFQWQRADGVTELQARYILETSEGPLIYIENSGLRHGPGPEMDKLRRGEPVDPALIYFRSTPRFETEAEPHAWLTRHVFVGHGARRPDRVELSIFQIL